MSATEGDLMCGVLLLFAGDWSRGDVMVAILAVSCFDDSKSRRVTVAC